MSATLRRHRPESCLSDLQLDRLVAGELERDPSLAAVQAHLATCEPCSARASMLRAEQTALGQEIWIAGEAKRIQRRLGGRTAWRVAAAITAAAAALVLAVRAPELAERVKGGAGLSAVVRRPDGKTAELYSGATVSPGDAVRFRVSFSEGGYLSILSADASGQVMAYVPFQGDPLPFAGGQKQLLDGSIVLDSVLGPERVVALLCRHPTPMPQLLEAMRRSLAAAGGDPARMGPLDTPCRQATLRWTKVAGK